MLMKDFTSIYSEWSKIITSSVFPSKSHSSRSGIVHQCHPWAMGLRELVPSELWGVCFNKKSFCRRFRGVYSAFDTCFLVYTCFLSTYFLVYCYTTTIWLPSWKRSRLYRSMVARAKGLHIPPGRWGVYLTQKMEGTSDRLGDVFLLEASRSKTPETWGFLQCFLSSKSTQRRLFRCNIL